MLRVERHEKAGRWPAADARDRLTLTYEERHLRRALLRTVGGEEILLDLPRAVLLEEGDGLALDSGAWIAVRAAAEALIEVRATSSGLICRLAWHLGNRHLPAQIEGERILIRPDQVIEAMLARLGAQLRSVHEPFHPEGGAYAEPRPTSHAHEHH
jgi:urease accessory protein